MAAGGITKSFYRAAVITLLALHLAFDVYKDHSNDIIRVDSIAVKSTKTGAADSADDSDRSLLTSFTIIASPVGNHGNVSPSHSPSVVSVESLEAEILAETIEKEEGGSKENLNSGAEEIITMDPAIEMPSAPLPAYEDWWDSGIRTNFDFRVPFNFSYIFFIGDNCNGYYYYYHGRTPDEWYSKFVKAGSATINVTGTICYEYDPTNPDHNKDNLYDRDFHLWGLEEVVRRVGDKLNETLVITVAVGLESDWTPVADLLKKGMAFWHAKEDPNNFVLEDYGLVPEEVLYFYFRWDEEKAALDGGHELCNIYKGRSALKYAQLWAGGRNGSLNYRTEMAIKGFAEACPETKLENVWNLYSNQTAAYKTTLLFNPYPDVILATKDSEAAEILQVAKDNLPINDYNQISGTGWNNNQDYVHLLEQRKILYTVNQMVHFPNKGIWRTIKMVLDIVQESGLNSTAAIQKELNIKSTTISGESTTILANTLVKSSDPAGNVLSNLLEGYDPDSPPGKEVQVSTGVWNTTLAQMDPFEGKFEAIFVLVASWYDSRLSWDPFVYEGTLTVDQASIWTPSGMYFQNEIGFDDGTILHTSATVVSDGTVTMEKSIHAMFLCETIDELPRYPFESYDCAMTLKGPMGTTLDTSFGFDVTQTDPHFKTTTDHTNSGGDENRSQIVNFKLNFVRRHFNIYVGLILPGIVINMIGFMAFWIPGLEESVALGIAALLCALTYRSTLEIPDIAAATWVEVFIMINTCYLFLVLIIIWLSYGSSAILGLRINRCCKPIHPKNVAKKGKALRTKLTASVVARERLGDIPMNDIVAELSSNDNSFDDPHRTQQSSAASKKEENRRANGLLKMSRFVSQRIVDFSNNSEANLDWIGRWFIVPSYVIVVSSLMIGGWGYK